jgi:hypothetical protein
MLCLFLGLLPHEIAPEQLQAVLKNRQKLKEALQVPQSELADVQGLCGFLRALATSASLGKDLLIDG